MKINESSEVQTSSVESRRHHVASVHLGKCQKWGGTSQTGTLITTEIINRVTYSISSGCSITGTTSPISIFSLICLSLSLTHSYWRICSFVSSSHRQPTFGACQTKAAVSKHLITAFRDSQDRHSWHMKLPRSPDILAEVKHGEMVRKKKEIWLILRYSLSCVSVQVIPI